MAISALGLKTVLGDFVKVGWRPAALLVLETVAVLLWVLVAIRLGLVA